MDPISIALALASQFAPSIVKYFSKSDTAAVVAGQVIDIAKTVTGASTPAAAQEAMIADPKLAIDFKLAVMANDAELEKAYLTDVQSARARDVEVIKASGSNVRANLMASAACSLVLICLVVVIWSSALDDFAKATVTLICGRALGWVEQVFSFEFGYTRASAKKDDTIKNLSK